MMWTEMDLTPNFPPIGREPGKKYRDNLPDFSGDIAYAWELVESLRNQFSFSLKIDDRYTLAAANTVMVWVCFQRDGNTYDATADSVSEVICKAALAALGIEVPPNE